MTLATEGVVDGRSRKQPRQFRSESIILPRIEAGVSHFRPGDLVQVHLDRLLHEIPRDFLVIWVRVERCDRERRIVFGIIESATQGLSKALMSGSRLGVSYDLVR